MEILKKNIKWIILVIVLMIIVSGLSVYATSTYLASQVIYKDVKTVEEALNNLYSIKNQTNITLLGSDTYDSTHYYAYEHTYDLTSYSNYQQFTEDNFILNFKKIEPMQSGNTNYMSGDISKSYNSETGILTVSLSECRYSTVGMIVKIEAYLIK